MPKKATTKRKVCPRCGHMASVRPGRKKLDCKYCTASRARKPGLPPGMTQDEYDAAVREERMRSRGRINIDR